MYIGRLSKGDKYDYYKHYRLSFDESVYDNNGIVGLRNLGNTCYINSIIQCLSYTLCLTDYILSNQIISKQRSRESLKIDQKIMRFQKSYTKMLSDLWSSNKIVNPHSFVTFFEEMFEFKRGEQQDSCETLLYILDTLHESLKYNVKMTINGKIITEADSLMTDAYKTWMTFYKNDYSDIKNMFYGLEFCKVSKAIGCKNDHEVKFDPYSNIHLHLPTHGNHCQLSELLDEYYTHKSEVCKEGCLQDRKLWFLPNIMIFVLKRFDNNGKKKDTVVEFPFDMDLTKFVSGEKNDSNVYKYVLYAVNYHSGSANSGHYWSICKNTNDKWYSFDDENVCQISDFNKQNIVTENAYILFYHRMFIN
jgi:ubiquitin C-terminal hydrolase